MRTYARAVGAILVLVGLTGITSLGELFFFLPKLNLVESFFHVSVGIMFGYVGFLNPDAEVVRSVVGGLGALLIVGKAVVIGTGLLFGDDHDLFGPLEVICVVVGISSVLAAAFVKSNR